MKIQPPIQKKDGAGLKTYGVYLTAEEAHLCDIEEELDDGYYEKIVIPVVKVNVDGETALQTIKLVTRDKN